MGRKGQAALRYSAKRSRKSGEIFPSTSESTHTCICKIHFHAVPKGTGRFRKAPDISADAGWHRLTLTPETTSEEFPQDHAPKRRGDVCSQ